MKKVLFYLVGLFMFVAVFAQGDYSFRVLANKGQSNKVKKVTGQEVTLRTGATLTSSDVLMVGKDAYIGLMHKTGKTIEIRKTGNISILDLEKNVKVGETSIASRYSSFISDRMNESEGGSYKSKMNATGAVSRGTNNSTIDLYLPDNSVLINNDRFILKWDTFNDSAMYIVKIYNIFDEEIFSFETALTYAPITLDKSVLYIVSVELKGDSQITSGKRGITLMKDNDPIMKEYNTLINEVDSKSTVGKLIYAMFFEEKGLYLDAITKYEDLVRDEPDVIDYAELYESFLLRNGLK